MRTKVIVAILVAAFIAVLAVVIAVPLVATSTPQFFARYHLLERRYTNLEDSAHEGIGCRDCHETQPIVNGLSLVGDFYLSLFTNDTLPKFFAFKAPERQACLKCHEDDWSSEAARTERIPHPAHQRVADEKRDCVQCHKWTAHLETYMEKHKKMPFSGVCVAYGCHVGTKVTAQCYTCHHILHDSAAQWKVAHPRIVRATGENACLENCHKVSQCQECHTTGKTPKFDGMTIEIGMKSIEKLHIDPQWTTKYHGPEAIKDKSKCMRCHQSQGECDECHRNRPKFHGSTDTWIGRHQKAAKKVDDPRCIECHKEEWCKECHDQFKEME